MSTAASRGGEARLVLIPSVISVLPSPLIRLTWSFLFALDPHANSVLGESLFAHFRRLLRTIGVSTEGLLGESLYAHFRRLHLAPVGMAESILGELLVALFRRQPCLLCPPSKTLGSEASLPCFRSFAQSLESSTHGRVRHARLDRTSTGETVTLQKLRIPWRGGAT
jgi:hypothetical protein